MVANLGSYLGLIGAAAVVWAGSRYIKYRVKKEVKIYAKENISLAKGRTVRGEPIRTNESGVINREPEVENEGGNEQPGRIQDKPITDNEPDKREPERTDKAGKSNRSKTPRVERLED
jgi:hypothetical protein